MKDISAGSSIFTQVVNTWREDETLRRLALHPKIAALATQLAGVPLRLWHDQILIKQPHNAATEFHQDQPYWPHNNSTNPISAWVALGDVPVERGCMTFIPGSQSRTDLRMQILNIKGNMFEIAPDLVYEERIAVPLRAGDLTFHHGRCAHMANPNETDVARVAHTIIYMDESTTYNAAGHVVTGPLDLEKGTTLSGEMFPHTDEFADLING